MRALFLLVCAGALACQSRAAIVLKGDAAQVSVETLPFSLSIADGAGNRVLSTLAANSADAYGAPGSTSDDPTWVDQILIGWDGTTTHEGAWHHVQRAQLTKIDARSMSFTLQGPSADDRQTLAISLDGATVHVVFTSAAGTRNKLGASFTLDDSERFFGLGERFASGQHRGQSLYSWAEEGGLGQGESAQSSPNNPFPNGPSMTWFPVPFLLSNHGYAMHLLGTARSELYLGSERNDAWRIAQPGSTLAFDVYVHAQPLDSIDDFTRDVGRPPVPPAWAFGPRREIGLGDTVPALPGEPAVNGRIAEWQALRLRGVPTTGLDDNVHFLPARSELGREDALRDWTSLVHANGFKVFAYATPYVSLTLPGGAEDAAYGEAHDLFVKDSNGDTLRVFFSSGQQQTLATIDLTHPQGPAFFQRLLTRAIDLGYDGWMHDFGEYVPPYARFADGRGGAEVHNEFPLLSAKAAHDLWESKRPGDWMIFARSGWAGSGQYLPSVWSGDPEATFDETQGLPANLRAGLSLSMSGAPYWGSDIAGYKCFTAAPNDKEMFLRWAEVGAVSVMMLNDTACATLAGTPKQKWTLWSDAETTQTYGAMARLHTRLQPYFRALAMDAHAHGTPLMRHFFLMFPQRAESWDIDDAFFLGPALLAAPVVRRGETVKHLWLPPGRYVDWDDLSLHEGDRAIDLAAPLTHLPLLLRAGQLVPLLDASVQTLAQHTEPSVISAQDVADRLDVRVALSVGEAASLTLADGSQLSASRGAADAGNPGALVAVDEAALPACALCALAESARPDGVRRVRANSSATSTSEILLEDLTLRASGPSARRIRWDVMRLP
ncbi:MAG: glycoside hydrolase family 31 protein [Deltaproteobacteria bacterium]|nr:glycoside hydrolase family 31 protein [Deltaproteobacteria bacterium]